MKKVTTPESKEEAVYYSDFSGKLLGELEPPVVLTINFNYGSKMDGALLRLDLTDEEIEDIIDLIKNKLNTATREEFKNTHKTDSNTNLFQYLINNTKK